MKNPIRFWSLTAFLVGQTIAVAENDSHKLITGKAAMGDWTSDAPGLRRKINVADLPPPGSNVLAINFPRVIARPADAQLRVPSGFKIDMYASSFRDPRFLLIVPYRNGDLKARGPAEKLGAHLSPGGLLRGGGHWTRDIVFSPDGKKMYVSIGSRSNVSDDASEANRARIFEFNPDGTGQKVYAWGIRNAVGIAFRPGTNELWMSTNERDEIGDDLPPDYISSVRPGGFYGWPWFYIGNHVDPRHKGKHVDLADKVMVPDVLLQPHCASLNLCFYTGDQFPAEYKGDIFAAFHGSWNRTKRTGYKIVRVPFDHSGGKALGEFEDFVTGFVAPNGSVWGRPVGIAVAKDGSLLFSEDGNGTIWRVSYAK